MTQINEDLRRYSDTNSPYEGIAAAFQTSELDLLFVTGKKDTKNFLTAPEIITDLCLDFDGHNQKKDLRMMLWSTTEFENRKNNELHIANAHPLYGRTVSWSVGPDRAIEVTYNQVQMPIGDFLHFIVPRVHGAVVTLTKPTSAQTTWRHPPTEHATDNQEPPGPDPVVVLTAVAPRDSLPVTDGSHAVITETAPLAEAQQDKVGQPQTEKRSHKDAIHQIDPVFLAFFSLPNKDLLHILHHLPQECRDVLQTMFVFKNASAISQRSPREVADLLGLTGKNVRRYKFEAKAKIREIMATLREKSGDLNALKYKVSEAQTTEHTPPQNVNIYQQARE